MMIKLFTEFIGIMAVISLLWYSSNGQQKIKEGLNIQNSFLPRDESSFVEDEYSLDGKLEIEGDIAQILQLFFDQRPSFSGHAHATLYLSGSFDLPHWNGSLTLSDGIYEIPEIGTSIKDLSATLENIGPRLQLTILEANDGRGGRISGSGYLLIDEELHHPYVLNLTLSEAAVFNQDYVQVVSNGLLTFQGNSEEGSLTGQLQASKASVIIPERSHSTINTVDVSYINVPTNTPNPQSYQRQHPAWPLALNIRLSFPRTLTINGSDLSSYWKGDLFIQGTAENPSFLGDLKIVGGEYLFNGNPFEINQGMISFEGDIEKKTTFYVIASKNLDKVKIDVIAKGPIKNPSITFRSNPPLPQQEILSWILFNRGTSEISPFQGTQLSESVTNLSSQQKGPDVLSKIRSLLRIDRLEIGQNSLGNQNDVNVQVGKYISDNILISIITSDVNRLAIEATINDNIKLQAQVGDDSQGQLLLKWKRDY